MRSRHTNRTPAIETPAGRLIGYARVSTEDQNLDMQIRALTAAGVDPANLHTDKMSGTTRKRPGLELALLDAVAGDTLVVWRLDRLGRSFIDLLNKIEALEARGVQFKSLTESIDTSTGSGRLLLHVLGAAAQFERDSIRERTKAGIAARKARGQKFGPEPIVDVTKAADMFRKGMSVDQVRRQFKGLGKRPHLSRAAIYKYFDAATITALREEGRKKRRKQ